MYGEILSLGDYNSYEEYSHIQALAREEYEEECAREEYEKECMNKND